MHDSAMQSVKNDIVRRWKTPKFGSLPHKPPSPIQTKFGTIDYVAEFNISAKFGSDRIIGVTPRGGKI